MAKLKVNAITIETSNNQKTLLKIFSLFAKFPLMISPKMATKPYINTKMENIEALILKIKLL